MDIYSGIENYDTIKIAFYSEQFSEFFYYFEAK